MDSSLCSTLHMCLLLCQFGEKRPGGCQNDKHLSRKGPRDPFPVRALTHHEHLWVISGLEQIRALTQQPALMSSPN